MMFAAVRYNKKGPSAFIFDGIDKERQHLDAMI